ncbi:hypothetical protein MCC93_14840 [Morococcus cerebrosus]|uniref:Uncharacterized protein n=1 Tax=Morococcus cerebrosus TaxID=1056807 RepID=A0A0C1GZ94_9NEIS|nr:hypothetical protein MCC93_14840 [Morococcus cerebrosus]
MPYQRASAANTVQPATQATVENAAPSQTSSETLLPFSDDPIQRTPFSDDPQRRLKPIHTRKHS